MHVCAVLIYDLGADSATQINGPDLHRLLQGPAGNEPLFTRQLLRVPMDLDTPYWTDGRGWRWEQHYHEYQFPSQGGWQELHELLDDIHGARMNLAKPLWELHLINELNALPGLPQNCQALILKAHHAAIDGVSLAGVINALHQIDDKPTPDNSPQGSAPDLWEMWTRSSFKSVERQFKLIETVGNLIPGLARARRSREQFADLPPVHNRKAKFNAPVAAGRHSGSILLPMDDVTAIRRAVRRVTVNDIALTCVAGALRTYLSKTRSLPDGALVAGVPVSLRSAKNQDTPGNQIATMRVGLATQEIDPVERLRLIHRYAVAGKKQLNALGTGTVMDISDSVTPNLLSEGIRTLAWATRLADAPVPFHTMVSNVPGPNKALHLGAAELVATIGLGPIRDNMGLFHIVSNCPDRLGISFSACARLMPDHHYYRQCLWDAYQALREASLEI
jgi:WS/DGAT/MGAT family acyltransferase